ncbi:MAG: hypothetical protein ACI9AX_001581, partial [Polaromonas sp.]
MTPMIDVTISERRSLTDAIAQFTLTPTGSGALP